MTSRTHISSDGSDVTVTRTCPLTGERDTTTYFVRGLSEGYVCIRDAAGRFPQVCERLSSTGPTLRATTETLPAVIRRELRRRNRADAKILASL